MPRPAAAHPPLPDGFVRVLWADEFVTVHRKHQAHLITGLEATGWVEHEGDALRLRLPRDQILEFLLKGFRAYEEAS